MHGGGQIVCGDSDLPTQGERERGRYVRKRLIDKLNSGLERHLPEQRLFLKSDTGTRFIRLRPVTIAGIVGAGSSEVVAAVVH